VTPDPSRDELARGIGAAFLVTGAGDDRWMNDAACAGQGPDVMFPVTMVDQQRATQAICAGCPVRRECLGYALANYIDDGIWGGTTEEQRRWLRRERAKGATLDEALEALPPPQPHKQRLSDARAAVLALARQRPDGITTGYVVRQLGITREAAHRRLNDLLGAGHLRRVERGLYAPAKEPAGG